MLGDRICKKSGGKFDITLSPQDMLNCAWENMGNARMFVTGCKKQVRNIFVRWAL
jgi:hypothetical protein